MTRRKNPQSGQALVEFALQLTVFLAMMIGIFDWSWTMFMHQTLASRAFMAARWAAVRPYNATTQSGATDIVLYGKTPCASCSVAFGLTSGMVSVTKVDRSYSVSSLAPVATSHIVVTISGYTVQHYTPGLSSSFAGRTITASQEWECANDACTTP